MSNNHDNTETSMTQTTATETQCRTKDRGAGLLSPLFGNSKINEKELKSLHFLVFFFLIAVSLYLLNLFK